MIEYNNINNNIMMKCGECLTINEIELSWRCFDEILKYYPQRIAIDLSEITSIDSAGIGFLVKVYKKTRIYCIELVFIGMSDSLKRLFLITGLLPFFNIMQKEEFEAATLEFNRY